MISASMPVYFVLLVNVNSIQHICSYAKFSTMRLQQESATVAFVVKESVPDSFVMFVYVCAILVHLLSNCLHCRMFYLKYFSTGALNGPCPFRANCHFES